jgi:hypothetical protein
MHHCFTGYNNHTVELYFLSHQLSKTSLHHDSQLLHDIQKSIYTLHSTNKNDSSSISLSFNECNRKCKLLEYVYNISSMLSIVIDSTNLIKECYNLVNKAISMFLDSYKDLEITVNLNSTKCLPIPCESVSCTQVPCSLMQCNPTECYFNKSNMPACMSFSCISVNCTVGECSHLYVLEMIVCFIHS